MGAVTARAQHRDAPPPSVRWRAPAVPMWGFAAGPRGAVDRVRRRRGWLRPRGGAADVTAPRPFRALRNRGGLPAICLMLGLLAGLFAMHGLAPGGAVL